MVLVNIFIGMAFLSIFAGFGFVFWGKYCMKHFHYDNCDNAFANACTARNAAVIFLIGAIFGFFFV